MPCKSFEPDFPVEIIQEGKTNILVPKLKMFVKHASEYAPSKAPVFYNPIMELNRDLAVLALQAYQFSVDREISICEPLAACGLRGIRFATEVNSVKRVVLGDINEKAFQLAKHNVRMNNLNKRVSVRNEEANFLLSSHSAPHRRFDAIDIDPFGSPVPFLDSAVRALRNGGLLALTATDLAPLCGVHPKACIRKYGGKPLRTEYCHELAVRLLAGCLVTVAAKHDIGLDIVFTHRAEHYVRAYATIKYGAETSDETIKNMGYVMHCFKCLHRETVRGLFTSKPSDRCSECNGKLSLAGPLWLGRLFNRGFCDLMKEASEHKTFRLGKQISKLLTRAKDEAEGPVTYYVVDRLCDTLNLPVPGVRGIVEELKGQGFAAFLTGFHTRGFRTNASSSLVKELLTNVSTRAKDRSSTVA